MKKSYLAIGALVLAAVIAIVLWKRGGDKTADSGAGVESAADGAAGAGATRRAAPTPLKGTGAGSSGELAGGNGFVAGGGPAVVPAGNYPPTSRPLDPNRRSDSYPNTGAERVMAVRSTPAAGTSADPGSETSLSYVLKADKYAIAGSDVLKLTLEVQRGKPGAGGERVAVKIVDASVNTPPQPGNAGRKMAALEFNDEGRDGDVTAGDLLYTSRFIAARSSFAQTAGTYFPLVVFEPEGAEQVSARISFSYTPEQAIPARFTGTFSDRQVDGSLLIGVGVDVLKPGEFFIDGTLVDRDGRVIGLARHHGPLDAGKGEVTLSFYGLMFREKKVDGPYTLRYVRGHRSVPGEQPNREDMAMYVGGYETADYLASSFTDAPFDGGGQFGP